MAWKLAIFDWDGTLVDSREFMYLATCEIFRHYGVKEFPPQDIYFKEQVTDFLPFYHRFGVPVSATRQDLNRLWQGFFNTEQNRPPLRAHTAEVLNVCRSRGLYTAIVSGSPAETIQAHLKSFKLSDSIDYVHADACGKINELRTALKHFDTKPSEAFYVDDTFEGVSAAKRIGICAIGMEGGFNSRSEIQNAEPDYVLSSFAQLSELLNKT